MTALYGYDGASPFNLRAARKHGGIVATVYIVGTPGGFAHADRARVNEIRAHGMGVLPNWERAADFFRTATLADCRAAGREALEACRALGIPDDGTVGVAFSFDYQVPASGFARATAQLKACGEGMAGHYRPLGYGQIDLIEYWAAHGLPGPHWLMGSTWRSSSVFAAHEVGSPHVALVQSHDAHGAWLSSPVPGTDINTVTQPSRLPAWWPTSSPYASPVPADLLEEIMALAGAPKDYKTFLADVAAAVAGSDDWRSGHDGYKKGYQLDTVLRLAVGDHVDAKLAAVATVVNALAPRVAQLQAAVAKLEPGQPVSVDAAAIAADVAAAVKQLQLVATVEVKG